jgi:hypothetical protein
LFNERRRQVMRKRGTVLKPKGDAAHLFIRQSTSEKGEVSMEKQPMPTVGGKKRESKEILKNKKPQKPGTDDVTTKGDQPPPGGMPSED